MKSVLYLAVIGLVLMACNENRIYKSHQDPSGNLEWNRSEVIKNDIEIIDISTKYNVYLALRFANGFAYPKCDVKIKETSPSGVETEYDFQFITMSDKGYLGEGAGDIFDLESIWLPQHSFSEVGTYHYEIRHQMPDEKIHMVMEVGMIVDKIPVDVNQP